MTTRAYVYLVPDHDLPAAADHLEVLVTVYDNVDDEHAPPEVALRPWVDGQALRVWGVPLELVRQT